jgi:hypothetical protein
MRRGGVRSEARCRRVGGRHGQTDPTPYPLLLGPLFVAEKLRGRRHHDQGHHVAFRRHPQPAEACSSLMPLQQETSAESVEGYRAPLQHDHHALHHSATLAASGASLAAQMISEGALSVHPRETVV